MPLTQAGDLERHQVAERLTDKLCRAGNRVGASLVSRTVVHETIKREV